MQLFHRLGICVSLAFIAGCSGGQGVELGRVAERKGQYHLAYDHYLQAATRDPDNAAAARGMARVGPFAAQYWETQGHVAIDQGRRADAYRMFMRALWIRPDHSSAAQLISHMERDNADEIRLAKADWLARGPRSLLSVRPPAVDTTAIAAAIPRDEPLDSEQPLDEPVSASDAAPPGPTPRPGAAGPSLAMRPPRPAPTEPVPARTAAPPPKAQPKVDEAPKATPSPVSPPARTSPAPPRERPREPRPQPARPTPSRLTPALEPPPDDTQVVPGRSNYFLVLYTISRKDKRFPKSVEAIDGIAVRLHDTDDKPDRADLDLYQGKRRIAKFRELGEGQDDQFIGASGRRFKLTVVDVNHRTQTVRFGIGPG